MKESWRKTLRVLLLIGIVLFVILAIGFVVLLEILYRWGMGMWSDISIKNDAGEDIWVTAYGEYDGPHGVDKIVLPGLLFFLQYKNEDMYIPKDGKLDLRFNWDDQSLRYFIVKNKEGDTCKIKASKYYGQSCCCSPPENETFSIPPLDGPECLPP